MWAGGGDLWDHQEGGGAEAGHASNIMSACTQEVEGAAERVRIEVWNKKAKGLLPWFWTIPTDLLLLLGSFPVPARAMPCSGIVTAGSQLWSGLCHGASWSSPCALP